MQNTYRRHSLASLVALAVLVLTACPDRATDGTAVDTPGAAPAAADASQAHMSAAGDTDLARAARDHRLSMPLLERYAQAARNLQQLEQTDPEVRRRMDAMGDQEAQSIDEVTRAIEADPQIRQAIERAGMNVRDYMLTSVALMQAMMASDFQRQGFIQELPPEVSADNVQFVRENETRIRELLEAQTAGG
jgi:hypothetical protein